MIHRNPEPKSPCTFAAESFEVDGWLLKGLAGVDHCVPSVLADGCLDRSGDFARFLRRQGEPRPLRAVQFAPWRGESKKPMSRLMGLLALGLASCPPVSSPQPLVPPADDKTTTAPGAEAEGQPSLEGKVFAVEDMALRSVGLARDARGRTRWLLQDNNNGLVHLSPSPDGDAFVRVRESRAQAKRLAAHVVYDASRDAVWRLFVDKTSFFHKPQSSEHSQSRRDPVEVPLGGAPDEGRSGVETYRVVNEVGLEGSVKACPVPARASTPAPRRGKHRRGLSMGDRSLPPFCDHVITAAHADSRGLFMGGSLEAGRQGVRPWAGLLDPEGALVWQAPLLVANGNTAGAIRELAVAGDDVYAIAMLATPSDSMGHAYFVRFEPQTGEARIQGLPGPTQSSGWAAIATEKDRVWVAMYQHSRTVALFEFRRDGTPQATREIALEGTVGYGTVAALGVDTGTLALATARTGSAEPGAVELIEMDRNGTVVQREHGQLPKSAYPRGAQWIGDQVTISVASSSRGPTLHRFTMPR